MDIKGKLKVYGGTTYGSAGQLRIIIAAASQKEAAKLVSVSLYEFRHYWGQTLNQTEIKMALSKPGTIFCRPLNDYKSEYIEMGGS